MSIKEPQTPQELLQQWHHRSRSNQKGHYMMAERASRANFWIGSTSAFVSATVAVLVIIAAKADPPPGGLLVFIAALSIFGGALATIITSTRWSERAQQHMGAGAAYGSVLREVAQALAMPLPAEPELTMLLDRLREKMDAIPETAPYIPERLWPKIPEEITPSKSGKLIKGKDDENKSV